MTASLEGRVALVTGGAQGVGLAIACTLIARGAKVVIADNGASIDGREEDSSICEKAAASLGEAALAYPYSIATRETAGGAVQAAVDRFGGLDIVVNNAAIIRDALIFKTDPKDFELVVRTNLVAAAEILTAATPILRENFKANRGGQPYGWGRIVNIVSSAGLYGNFGQSAYASAKAGLVGLTRVVAMEMARSAVTCNAVAPFAHTRVTESIQPANDAQARYKQQALTVKADHVAGFVAYLASPEAQDVTGQLFGVRGRQVFLFTQPRPIATLTVPDGAWDPAAVDALVRRDAANAFTDLSTDLEAFSAEPVI